MEVESYKSDRPKHTVFGATIGVFCLSILAATLTVSGFAWQEVLDLRPACNQTVENPVVGLNRREGLFEICLLDAESRDVCYSRSYGYQAREKTSDSHQGLFTILEYRWTVVICLAAAFVFAFIAAIFSAIFLCIWHKVEEDTIHLLFSRITTTVVLFLSGVLYEIGLFFLHLSYLKEKTSLTNVLPYSFPMWPEVLKRHTDIQYSLCYYFFWVALIAVYIGAMLFVITSVIASQSKVELDVEVNTKSARHSLPRFSVQEVSGIQRLFLLDAP